MKYTMWLLIILLLFSCDKQTKEKIKLKEATIVEMVLYDINDGIHLKAAKKEIKKLNNFINKQEGFISRTTAISDEDQFLDIVYWTDLNAAKSASKKAMKNTKVLESFKVMDEESMTFKYFSIFNKHEKNEK